MMYNTDIWRLGGISPTTARTLGGGSSDFTYALSRCQFHLKQWIVQEVTKALKCSESDIIVQKLELSVDRSSYLGGVILDLVVDIRDPTFAQTVHTAKMFKRYPITDCRIEMNYRVDRMENEFALYNQVMYREILECIRTVQTQGVDKMKILKEFGKQTREEWAKDPVLSKYLEPSKKA